MLIHSKMEMKMKYKYIRFDPDKFKIKYNGTRFKDINEFVMDLKNIFSQFNDIYEKLKKNILNTDGPEVLHPLIVERLEGLQKDLQKKLSYITDPDKVSKTLIGKTRSKLIQLKSLNRTTDLTKDTENNITRICDYYNKRVLEKNLIITKKIYSYNKR